MPNNRFSWWVLLNISARSHGCRKVTSHNLDLPNTFWSPETGRSTVPDGDSQWCCGGQISWGLTPFSLLAWSHQPLLAMASSIWVKCSDRWHRPFIKKVGWWEELSQKGILMGHWGQSVRKNRAAAELKQKMAYQREGCTGMVTLQWLCCCCSLLSPSLLLKLVTQKRIMICWGRKNFPLPQAVKHLIWAILKCQHKCVLVYRKKYYY